MQSVIAIAPDEAAFSRKAAQVFLEAVTAAVRDRKQAAVALSGGSTPLKLFSTLADSYHRDRIPWAQTFFFWTDERCVSPEDPQSNYKQAHDLLFSKVPVPAANLFRIPGEMDPPFEAARAAEQVLRRFFKTEATPPKFDLILLGMGEDGHTASLFPGTAAVNEKTHWVAAQYVEKLSANRVTLTLPVINAAREVAFLVSGDGKAAMVKQVLGETGPRHNVPAQLVAPVEGTLLWLLDRTAASKLPESVRQKAISC